MKTKITQSKGLRQQRGLVVLLFTFCFTILLAFAALAIDINHLILNNARVQNSVDSAALSASVALENGADLSQAANAAVTTIMTMASSAGNNELDLNVTGNAGSNVAGELQFQSANGTTVTVQFSNNPITFPSSGSVSLTEDIYTRVAIDGHNLDSFFLQVFAIDKVVQASAVAGRSSGMYGTNISPIGVCEQGSPNFGYETGVEYQLAGKTNGNSNCKNKNKCDDDSPDSGDIGSGNYNYLSLDGYGNGADGLADAIGGKPPEDLADGETGAYYVGGTVDTKPGVNNGPVTGFNSRWNEETGFPQPDTDTFSSTYEDYVSAGYGNGRRTMILPVVDCSAESNGASTIEIKGFACYFLTQEYDKNQKIIWGEFFVEGCTLPNGWGGQTPSATGPYKIQLYRDLTTGDA